MKVAILGMFDKWLPRVGNFPHLDIRYQWKKHGAGEDTIIKTADRIVLMTKFTTHGLYDKLDKTKLVYVNGGITKLNEILANLNATARIQAVPQITVTGSELPEENDMARANTFDFSPLATGKTGFEFTLTRPQSMDVSAFVLAIQQGRSYYKRTHGVLSEQTLTGGKGQCRIKILKSKAEAEAEKKQPAIEESVVLGKAEPQIREAPAETPVTAVGADVSPPDDNIKFARLFWREVFMQSLAMCPSAPPSQHVSCAELAVTAWLTRFGS